MRSKVRQFFTAAVVVHTNEQIAKLNFQLENKYCTVLCLFQCFLVFVCVCAVHTCWLLLRSWLLPICHNNWKLQMSFTYLFKCLWHVFDTKHDSIIRIFVCSIRLFFFLLFNKIITISFFCCSGWFVSVFFYGIQRTLSLARKEYFENIFMWFEIFIYKWLKNWAEKNELRESILHPDDCTYFYVDDKFND